jgi:hypothetical protein
VAGDLSGVKAKIARAQMNLDQFNLEQGAWFDTKPYTVTPEIHKNVAPGWHNILFVVTRVETIPDPIRTIVGDCLYDLRSALDHLAWQLVVANNGTPTDSTAFPILDDRLGRKHGVRPLEISGDIDQRAFAIIESLQPYQRVDDPTADPLWLLNELTNIDKHRLLLVCGLAFTQVTSTFDGETRPFSTNPPIPLIVGGSLGTIGFRPEGSETDPLTMKMEMEPAALIAFDGGEPCGRQPVGELLARLKQEVESVVGGLAVFIR